MLSHQHSSGQIVESNGNLEVADGKLTLRALLPGAYIVLARVGNDVSYCTVQVQPNATAQGRVDSATPASVTARIVAGDGNPITGAVLRWNVGGYADFPAGPQTGLRGVSGSTGLVELAGVHPAQTDFVIEAAGFEVATRTCAPSPGSTTDLGDIRLEAATGRIQVKLSGTQTPEKFQCALLHPQGGSGYSTMQNFSPDGMVTFSRVAGRAYLVMVRPVGGGKVSSMHVVLDTGSMDIGVVIDVAALEGS